MIYGHGIDIVEVSRIQKAVENSKNFKHRIFTELEIDYCESMHNKYPSYAARFAAKEAFLKAMGTGLTRGILWKDIEVINDEYGKPQISLHSVAKEIYDDFCLSRIFVSLSHTKSSAIASVILL